MDQSNERPAIYWLLNIVHWLRSCKLYLQYGDIGCGVSNSGIQNYVDFLPESELIPRKFWYFLKWNNAKPTLFLQNRLFHKWLIWKVILSKNWTGICFKMLLWLKNLSNLDTRGWNSKTNFACVYNASNTCYYCAKTNLQLVFSFTPIKGRVELSRTTPCQLMSINKLVWPLKLLQGILG